SAPQSERQVREECRPRDHSSSAAFSNDRGPILESSAQHSSAHDRTRSSYHRSKQPDSDLPTGPHSLGTLPAVLKEVMSRKNKPALNIIGSLFVARIFRRGARQRRRKHTSKREI